MRGQIRHNGVWRNAVVSSLAVVFLLFSGVSRAASLERIEVASSLGQPLYAEVPLKLESGELVSKVFIEIASEADYKIFEVYRDPILSSIRADVASDERGARVKLTSRSGITTPFFNLVLKVRYGRVSHFKKYSVFLDAAKSIERVATLQALPQVESENISVSPSNRPTFTESSGNALITEQAQAHAEKQAKQKTLTEQNSESKSNSWARTDRYGPIVRGDSLSIVAQRLRMDNRYSKNQVMVALFEKNRASFDRNNMNLIKAGSFLLTPSDEEVKSRNKAEAFRVAANHEASWKEQPRYSVEAEVQRSRYTNRVSLGEQADGEATAFVAKPVEATQNLLKPEEEHQSVMAESATIETEISKPIADLITPQIEKMMQVQLETNQLLVELQAKNEALQQQLIANKDSVDELAEKVDEGETAASNARVEKLEILLIRLQAQLEKQAQAQAQQQPNAQVASSDWVTWILLGLVIVMLGVITMRMRKEPVHPASELLLSESKTEPELAEQGAETEETLEEVVEEAVGSIETNEANASKGKAGTSDSMASFSDELSDTDTTELETFDVDAKQELDANVDYLSEADVYIRYGMDDEALQQLDLALRLNANNTNAHIKKAELLHGKDDQAGFTAAVAAATVALAAVELNQYKAALESFGGAVDTITTAPSNAVADPVSEPEVETTEVDSSSHITIDDVEIDELDFSIAGLDVAGVESSTADEPDQEEELVEELDWLSDPSLLAEEDVQDDAQFLADVQTDSDAGVEKSADLSFEVDQEFNVGGALPPLNIKDTTDSLEFSEEDSAVEEFGNLLSEFNEPSINVEQTSLSTDKPARATAEADDIISMADIEPSDIEIGEAFEAGATQELGSLLSEFSEEEDSAVEEFGNLLSEFNEPANEVEQPVFSAETENKAEELGAGATQELGHLFSEFSEEDSAVEEFGNLLSEFNEPTIAVESLESSEETAVEVTEPVGAAQELGSLLSEFTKPAVEVEQSESSEETAVEVTEPVGAAQELGNLLSEFSGQVDAEDKGLELDNDVVVPSSGGAAEELGGLLAEFTEVDNSDANAPVAGDENKTEATESFEVSEKERLDELLGEFSDDDDLSFATAEDGLDIAAVIEETKAASAPVVESLGVDLDHGATQELDSLLAEFADEESGLGLTFIDSSEDSTSVMQDKNNDTLQHGATQELNTLLGEFSETDDVVLDDSDYDHGATQVLGNLLDEFDFDDDDKDDKKG